MALNLVVSLLAAFLIGAPGLTHAVEFVDPTPEQKARCTALPYAPAQEFCTAAYSVKGLTFPEEATGLGAFRGVDRMSIFKPDGNGPFPALVLLHTCGYINDQHFRYWVKYAIEQGYVAFVVDSWVQRAVTNCGAVPKEFDALAVRTRDAVEALQHLQRFKFIDTSRVGAIGFSQGGRVAYLLAGRLVPGVFAPGGKRFAAVVAMYGECYSRSTKRSNILQDINVPILALLGAKDEDGDPAQCIPRLEAAKSRGAIIEWHVFPDTGHAWDQPIYRVPQREPYGGSPSGSVYYAYNSAVTDESRDRAFAHFARYLKLSK